MKQKKRERKAKNHNTGLRKLSDLLRKNNICTIRVPEDEEREKGVEHLCEQILAENFPFLSGEGHRHQNPRSGEKSY